MSQINCMNISSKYNIPESLNFGINASNKIKSLKIKEQERPDMENSLRKVKREIYPKNTIEKKIKLYDHNGQKFYNLYTTEDLKFEAIEDDIEYRGTENDSSSDEDVINASMDKTKEDLKIALKLFKKYKFKVINNYN